MISFDRAEVLLSECREGLTLWQGAGYAGEMGFMLRDPGLFTDLKNFLPEVRSVLSFLAPYASAGGPEILPPGVGRVARYAWGLDYHAVLKGKLREVVSLLEESLGAKIRTRAFSDAVPLLERALATSLGFIGRNTLLIRPGLGSYAFIAEILIDVEVSGAMKPLRVLEPERSGSGCGKCSRCIARCPTGALVEGEGVDARRCIAYLTIEKRTVLDDWEAKALSEWIFGCDLCQEVCPFNAAPQAHVPLLEFAARSGAGPVLELSSVLEIDSEAEFRERFGKTALMRAGRAGLVRNAICVAMNRGEVGLREHIERRSREDASPVVREQAARALERLSR